MAAPPSGPPSDPIPNADPDFDPDGARGAEFARLTERAMAGERAALEALLEHHLPDLRAFVRLRAGPLVRAQESNSDLVQSVCREVLEHAARFKHGTGNAFKHWLFTTALRKIMNRHDFYRAQKRDALRAVSMDATGTDRDAVLVKRYRSFSSPSRAAVVREEMERIEAAFEQLTEEQREVVSLAHIVGLSRQEIAEQIGKSEGAVRVILHRALVKLSGLLGEPARE